MRWLTAGESHGPALVAVLEGVPAGVEVTSADVARDLARRRLGYGRGARMSFEQDEVEILGGVRHGVTLGSPVAIRVGNTRVAQVGDGDGGRSGRPRAAGRPGPQRAADPAPARPRRPGRHAEVRPHRRPADPGAGQRPRDRRPGARSAWWPSNLLRQALGVEIVSHVVELGTVAVKPGLLPTPEDAERIDADPLRCLDPEASAPDGRGGRRGQAGRGHARRHRRGAGLRRTAGSGQPRPVGPQARRPHRRRALLHPGHQGRGDRRRVHPGPLARLAWRTTRSCRPRPGSGG